MKETYFPRFAYMYTKVNINVLLVFFDLINTGNIKISIHSTGRDFNKRIPRIIHVHRTSSR